VIKLLLVEDDPDMLDLTAYVLRRERFVVAEASDGAQAIRRWKADQPDLVILDLGLPSLDGFEVLRRIREDGNTPVLIVTGRRDAQDILRAFNLGTDDFVPKPFEFRELIARVRAILRRAKTVTQEVSEPRLQLDGLTLDPQTYEVSWLDKDVRLTPTEFRILYLLATNAGRVVPASRLYTYVWGKPGCGCERAALAHQPPPAKIRDRRRCARNDRLGARGGLHLQAAGPAGRRTAAAAFGDRAYARACGAWRSLTYRGDPSPNSHVDGCPRTDRLTTASP